MLNLENVKLKRGDLIHFNKKLYKVQCVPCYCRVLARSIDESHEIDLCACDVCEKYFELIPTF